jgi:hypothetical protein
MASLSKELDRAIARENRAFLADPKAIAEARAEGEMLRLRLEANGTLPPADTCLECGETIYHRTGCGHNAHEAYVGDRSEEAPARWLLDGDTSMECPDDCDCPRCQDENESRCPVCGDFSDYCLGHGEIGDPAGFAILTSHDAGNHDDCHPEGCEEAPRHLARLAPGSSEIR